MRTHMLRGIALAGLLGLLACNLAACTLAQQQAATTDVTTGCRAATAAEAQDPAFGAHNGKIIKGQAYICAIAPVVINLLPPAPATTPPASQ